jgi:Rad3-related DNA helicase
MEGSQELLNLSIDNLLQNFPFEFRGNQSDILNQIGKALTNPKIRFVVVQAPTGTGKSPLAIAAARSVGSSYVMTPTKPLQDQYARDFRQYFADMRGRGNYACTEYAGNNCASAPCRTNPGLRQKCGGCEYKKALTNASEANITLFNFAAALSFLNHTKNFQKRDLMIIDEAHMIEDQLTSFIEFSINLERLRDFGVLQGNQVIPDLKTPAEYVEFMEGMVQISDHIFNNYEDYAGPNDYEEFEAFHRKLKSMIQEALNHPENLLMDKELDLQGNLKKLTFRPFKIHRYASDYLFKYADKSILLSATILNYNAFIRSLGISPSEAAWIDVPSTFPAQNRPIIRKYVAPLNFKNLKEMTPQIAKKVTQIMDDHAGDKGIIHTSSYMLAQEIFDLLPERHKNRILFPKSAKEQADFLEEHGMSKEPTVLLSPSMAEGIDLKDDLSRFQIITKIPYPSTQDKVIQARMNADREWYGYRTCLKVIQSYGRSVRSETDKAITYVLDGKFDDLLADNYRTLPKWFLEAISAKVIP